LDAVPTIDFKCINDKIAPTPKGSYARGKAKGIHQVLKTQMSIARNRSMPLGIQVLFAFVLIKQYLYKNPNRSKHAARPLFGLMHKLFIYMP